MNDSDAPATKAELQVLSGDIQTLSVNVQTLNQDVQTLKGDVQTLKGDVQALTVDMRTLQESLTETMRDVQTELLRAFYSYTSSTDLKFKESEASDHHIRERLGNVESRVTEIERRLNLPPTA